MGSASTPNNISLFDPEPLLSRNCQKFGEKTTLPSLNPIQSADQIATNLSQGEKGKTLQNKDTFKHIGFPSFSVSKKYKVNPDNVATPIAASLGDLVTLGILSLVATRILDLQSSSSNDVYSNLMRPQAFLAEFYLVVAPICFVIASKTSVTKDVLASGWTPVLTAMMISSGGGKILSSAISAFPDIAAYQPIINGVAGNLVSVHVRLIPMSIKTRLIDWHDYEFQASRITTKLHLLGVSAVKGKDNSMVMILLLAMVVPGHFIFLHALNYFQEKDGSVVLNSMHFAGLYFIAAFIQVGSLLVFAEYLVKWLWLRGTDPDSAAIPYLTSLGDLFGGILLAGAFYINDYIFTSNQKIWQSVWAIFRVVFVCAFGSFISQINRWHLL